jgi:hypothetical protein
MQAAIRASCFAYRVLLISYPGEFRERFGREMAEMFADQLSEEWEQRGLAGSMRVALTAFREIVAVALPLQLRNSVVIAGIVSFVSSSVLFLALFRAVSR